MHAAARWKIFFPRYGTAHGHAQEPTPGSAVEHCRFLDTGGGGGTAGDCIKLRRTHYALRNGRGMDKSSDREGLVAESVGAVSIGPLVGTASNREMVT